MLDDDNPVQTVDYYTELKLLKTFPDGQQIRGLRSILVDNQEEVLAALREYTAQRGNGTYIIYLHTLNNDVRGYMKRWKRRAGNRILLVTRQWVIMCVHYYPDQLSDRGEILYPVE